jgi:hypothetical protein
LLAVTAVKKGFELAEQMAAEGEVIEETAARLNMTEEAYQKLIGAGQLAGLSTGAISGKLMYFNRTLAMAAEGGGRGAEKLTKLGIAFKNSDGTMRDSNEVLSEVSDRIKNTTSQSEKLALVTGLFGRGGAAMLRFLSLGGDEIKRLGEEAKTTGGLMDEKLLTTLHHNEIAVNKYHLAVKGVRNTLVNYLLPVIGWLYDKGRALAEGMAYLATKTHVFEAVAMVLGAVTLVTLISRLGAVAQAIKFLLGSWKANLIMVGVAALILLVDDLLALFSGGRSVIGAFLDSMFGFGTAADYVQILREELEALIHPLETAMSLGRHFFEMLGFKGNTQADREIGVDTGAPPAAPKPGEDATPWKGMTEPTTAPSPFLNPTAGAPTRAPAQGRSEDQGLLSGLANKQTTRDWGRGVFASERLRKLHEEQAKEHPIPATASIPAKTETHTTTIDARSTHHITVQAPNGRLNPDDRKALESIVDRQATKNAENARRALRTAAP